MALERSSSERGFTLAEILVAMAIGLVVMAAVYSAYMSQQKSNEITQEVSALQQNIRAAMYYLERELRMAGYNSDPKSTAKFSFLSITEGGSTVTFSKDADNDGAYDGTTGDKVEFALNSGDLRMRLGGDGPSAVWQTLAQNLTTLTFNYLTSTGATASSGDDVRSVLITLAGTSPGGHQRRLSVRVLCRNMGL